MKTISEESFYSVVEQDGTIIAVCETNDLVGPTSLKVFGSDFQVSRSFRSFIYDILPLGDTVMGFFSGCLFLCNLHDLSFVWTTPATQYYGVHLSSIGSDCVAVSIGSTLEIVSKRDGATLASMNMSMIAKIIPWTDDHFFVFHEDGYASTFKYNNNTLQNLSCLRTGYGWIIDYNPIHQHVVMVNHEVIQCLDTHWTILWKNVWPSDNYIAHAVCSSDGEWVVVQVEDVEDHKPTIFLLRVSTGHVVKVLFEYNEPIQDMIVSSDARRIIISSESGLRSWSIYFDSKIASLLWDTKIPKSLFQRLFVRV